MDPLALARTVVDIAAVGIAAAAAAVQLLARGWKQGVEM
jgi:hypothetical protein